MPIAAADALAVLDGLRTSGGVPATGVLDSRRQRAAIRTLERRALVETGPGGPEGAAAGARRRPGLEHLVLAVDIGGTKLRAAIADDRGDLAGEIVEPTVVGDADGLVAQVQRMGADLVRRRRPGLPDIRAAVIGIPGSYDPTTDRAWNVGTCQHLPMSVRQQGSAGRSTCP